MTVLDWSGRNGAPTARLGPPAACRHRCGKQAILRHPVTGDPCHKVCEEQRIDRVATADAGGAGA